MLRQLTLQNVLILGLLVVIAVPAYFAYRLMSDARFRHEFMNTAVVVDAKVPCLITLGNLQGDIDRHVIYSTYKVDAGTEYAIAIRALGALTDVELADLCRKAHDEGDLMIRAIAGQGEPGHKQP